MKRETFKRALVLAAAVVSPVLFNANAGLDTSTASVTRAIQAAPAAELGATATRLVEKAAATERESVAAAVIEATAVRHPAALKTVVASISRKSPQLAGKVAAKAAKLSPEQAADLAYVAALAARDQALEVAAQVGRAVPAAMPAINSRISEFIEVPLTTTSLETAATATAEGTPVVIERNSRASANPGGTAVVQTPKRGSSGGTIVIQKPKKNPPTGSLSGKDTPGADYGRP